MATRRTNSERKQEIVNAARSLYEEQGLACTSVQDIARKVNISRSLFYHYFPDKDAVTSAVLKTYIDDIEEALRIWNSERVEGEIEDALEGAVKLLKLVIFDKDSFRIALASNENAALYIEFTHRVADRIARYIVKTTVEDYRALHNIEIHHVYETFFVLIVGLSAFVRLHPDADNQLLKDLIAQTLHMERTPASKPASQDISCKLPAQDERGDCAQESGGGREHAIHASRKSIDGFQAKAAKGTGGNPNVV